MYHILMIEEKHTGDLSKIKMDSSDNEVHNKLMA